MKTEVDKQDINKLANAPSGLNNLKRNLVYLDAHKFKCVSVDLEKLSDVVSEEFVKKIVQKTKYESK